MNNSKKIILEGKNIKLFYQENLVLNGINITIHKKDKIAITGASGSGKSSLIQILGGLLIPSYGEVLLNGKNFNKISLNEKAKFRIKHIGFVYQKHNLLSEFSVLENVMIPQMILKKNKNIAYIKAKNILEKLGLKKILFYYPYALSGGQEKKVSIARALINEPDCIFCDESTGNLDPKSTEEVMELLLDLNYRKNIALVMVTHNLIWANRLSSCYSLQNGILKEYI